MAATLRPSVAGVTVLGPIEPGFDEILTPEALAFIAGLERSFGGRRKELLARRIEVQKRIDAGQLPDFLPETAEIRRRDWAIAATPADLEDRRVEITGPVDRKMVINALNSGANVFMADFEDSLTPTWSNLVSGQSNLRDAIRRTITFADPETRREYKLTDKTAVLLARPRGWHLEEKHILIDGAPMSGSLFDFGLYFFHNARELVRRGSGPYYYLPKLESHLEARLWNEVFVHSQKALGLANGTIKATVLIETILAAFEMDEILYELRDHIVGLNCGRWDYIFSFIKKMRNHNRFMLPDRGTIGMTRHFLRSYSLLLIKTCHRRNAHAMGGMAAQIPIRNDEAANRDALKKVEDDKLREVTDGHDGTWVAHPGLVGLAKTIFDQHMREKNQIARKRQDVAVTAKDLLAVPEGDVTEAGMRQNVNVGILYTEAWLRGLGCVPLYNLMEDAATAEISRTQLWQWVRWGAKLKDGRIADKPLFRSILDEEMANIRDQLGAERFAAGKYDEAAELFRTFTEAAELADFLTISAYDRVVAAGG